MYRIIKVKWKNDFEPYIVIERNQITIYDQRFVGFGWNKVSHTMTLNANGYVNFYVMQNTVKNT